ncbi:MAG: DUF3502 domain-containing protein [Lachnospiraceae bacterium]|nr:DUF3502 domain-containing protein [Lachnospiraceae bacterium]
MKKIICGVCLLMLLCIIGCNEKVPEKTGPVISTSSYVTESTTTVSEEPTTDYWGQGPADAVKDEERGAGQITEIIGEGEAERLGVEKTLVWVAANTPKETVLKKVNEILVNEYGCDFVVEFHEYNELSYFNPYLNYSHVEMLSDMKELGHKADIVYGGAQGEFSVLVEKGIYIPFDEYFSTEEGQKLYNAYAPEIWKKTMRDGKTYGYYSAMYPNGAAYALCNNELAGKYGITLPEDGWSFYDMGEILESARITKADIADNEELFCCMPNALLRLEGYYNLVADTAFSDTRILFKKSDDGKWIAVNPAGEGALIKLWKTIKVYADKGWYSVWDNEDASKNALAGRFVFCFRDISTADMSDIVGNKHIIRNRNDVCEVVIGAKEYMANEPQENVITGIASWSEHKEEALKLITLINTDAKLSNLFQYGVEGEHYAYEERMLYKLPDRALITYPAVFPQIGNINLFHPVFIDPDDKLIYSKEISANYIDAPTMIYDIEVKDYAEQLSKISEIYAKYAEILFSGECEDVEVTVFKMEEELSAAGINEIVAEINRQMREQEANK